ENNRRHPNSNPSNSSSKSLNNYYENFRNVISMLGHVSREPGLPSPHPTTVGQMSSGNIHPGIEQSNAPNTLIPT
ncbi:Hypothetical protein FKW44_017741, partial [Caligus rogercresseyi]